MFKLLSSLSTKFLSEENVTNPKTAASLALNDFFFFSVIDSNLFQQRQMEVSHLL